MAESRYEDGVLREQWNDTTRAYTAYDASGAQTSTRPYTTAENTYADQGVVSRAATANRATLTQQAETALAANKTFVAIASPTNAQMITQAKALSRQNNGIIRLLLNRLEATD